MIQRIQSVYLLLIAIFGVVLFMMPIANISGVKDLNYFLHGINNIDSTLVFRNYPLIAVNISSIIFAMFIVFNFKNRKYQIKLAKMLFALLLLLFFMVYVLYPFFILKNNLGEINVSFTFAFLFPLLSLIFNYLAIRGIKKDDDKVRSAERIR
ncbi:MAG: DUF4293 domain-containing protein [Bacteroidota bacterium]